MQIAGDPTRVRLNVDLSQYHVHLLPGVQGTTMPNVKLSVWGSQDRFVAVKFDCCGSMHDILWYGLDVLTDEDGAL